MIAVVAWGFAQSDPSPPPPEEPAPATQPGDGGAGQDAGGAAGALRPGAATQPSGPWRMIEEIMAAPEAKPEKRAELRKLRELAQAVLGDDVTPAELVKAAEPALLNWLQIDDAVALPVGVAADEAGPWAGIDARLREATRWLLWGEANPDYLAVCAPHVLLDWLGDRFSRRLAEHYMRLENLTLESDFYFNLVPGKEPKLEMPETLPKVFSVRMWNQPHRSRAEVTVKGKFVWGVISERRADGWYVTEWTPKRRVGPYAYTVRYEHRTPLRLVPSRIAPPYVPVACQFGSYALPMLGDDLVTNRTAPLNQYRTKARTGRTPHGSVAEYDGIARSLDGEQCYRFVCSLADGYRGYLYVAANREAPYVLQLDGAHVAGHPGGVVGATYGRITYHRFSTSPIDDAFFVPPDVPESSE